MGYSGTGVPELFFSGRLLTSFLSLQLNNTSANACKIYIPLQLSNYSKTRGLPGSPFLAPLLYKYSEKSSEVRELHLCPEKTRNLAQFVIGRSLFAFWVSSRNKENCERRSFPKDL